MSRSDKSSSTSARSSQPIYIAGAIWAFLAAMYFLTQSAPDPSQTYLAITAFFEVVAFFAASLLCLRNVLGSNSVSGKDVWLGLGIGLGCYAIGSCLFAYWEVVLGQSPDVSLGDLFYVPAYLFLIYGMVMAVIKRQLNLEPLQWAMVMVVGVLGIVFAIFVSSGAKNAPSASVNFNFFEAPAIAQAAPPTIKPSPVVAKPSIKPTPQIRPTPQAAPSTLKVPVPVAEPPTNATPEWASKIENFLRPYKSAINWIYVASDVCLVVIATALLTAFWGGRASQSWRVIAFAAFSLYIADMSVKYSTLVSANYSSGGVLEVFFIFAAVLFGIGATLEYDLSHSRRSSRRRT